MQALPGLASHSGAARSQDLSGISVFMLSSTWGSLCTPNPSEERGKEISLLFLLGGNTEAHSPVVTGSLVNTGSKCHIESDVRKTELSKGKTPEPQWHHQPRLPPLTLPSQKWTFPEWALLKQAPSVKFFYKGRNKKSEWAVLGPPSTEWWMKSLPVFWSWLHFPPPPLPLSSNSRLPSGSPPVIQRYSKSIWGVWGEGERFPS